MNAPERASYAPKAYKRAVHCSELAAKGVELLLPKTADRGKELTQK
jgi:hypothetical protein